MNTANLKTSIAQIGNTWKKYFPNLPFEYKFLDEDFNSQYAADQKRGKIFAAFSILTIIITCLGLLGLTAFTTQQKQKEISIRRVMGASIPQIVSTDHPQLFVAGIDCGIDCFSCCLLFYEQMATGIFLQSRFIGSPIYCICFFDCTYCRINCHVSFNKSGAGKPGEESTNRIRNCFCRMKLFRGSISCSRLVSPAEMNKRLRGLRKKRK